MKIVLKIGPQRAAWWQEHLSRLLPEGEVFLADQDMDRNQIDYAVVWRPEPRWLKTFTNLKCILSVHVDDLKGAATKATAESLLPQCCRAYIT